MILFTISNIIFFISLLFFKTKSNLAFTNILIALTGFCYILLGVLYLISNYFTGHGFNSAVLFHILFGVKGSATDLLILYTTVTIYFMLSIIGFNKLFNHNIQKNINQVIIIIFILISYTIHPITKNLYNVFIKPHLSYLQNTNPLKFDDIYRPLNIISEKNNTKNLILIYLESLENTFSNTNIFPDLTPNLNKLSHQAIVFHNMKQVTNTGWTIAGMVSSQCGISLFTTSDSSTLNGIDQFLPKAVCIGDLLKSKGYYQEYIGGARSIFAGKNIFYTTHGYNKIFGFKNIIKTVKDKNYQSSWGMYDDTMLDFAYQRFLKISKKHKKFNLTLLTLDTHAPKGYPSKSCQEYKNGDNPFLNSIHCSDYLIGKFITKIQQSKYSKNTTIVLLSDHFAMRNTADYLYLDKVKRTNRFIILNDTSKQKDINITASHLDIPNTILYHMGFTVQGGLGQNLLNPTRDINTTLKIHSNLMYWKKQFLSFWNFPKIDTGFNINLQTNKIEVKKREFKLPILLELDDKLHIKPKFEFTLGKSHNMFKLIDQAKTITQYILIHKCHELEFQSTQEMCVKFYNKNSKTTIIPIKTKQLYLSKQIIKKYLGLQ